jgi:hypothetical protein
MIKYPVLVLLKTSIFQRYEMPTVDYIKRNLVMKNSAVLFFLSLFCLSAGCAKYYYQEGKTFEECEKDRAECFSELKKHADWDMPGAYEHEFMEECMKSKGYRLVTENKLPLNVKRQDPSSSLYGQLYGARRGIAGTLDEQ